MLVLVNFVIKEWLKQTHLFIYFTNIQVGCFMIWLMHKSNIICYQSYYVDYVYIWSFKSDLGKHMVLPVSLKYLGFLHDLTSEKIWHYMLAN